MLFTAGEGAEPFWDGAFDQFSPPPPPSSMHVYSAQAGETEAVRVFTQKPAEGAVGGVGSGSLLVVDGYCCTVGREQGEPTP